MQTSRLQQLHNFLASGVNLELQKRLQATKSQIV